MQSNEQLVRSYLEWMTSVRRRSAVTVTNYERVYGHLLRHVGSKPLLAVSTAELETFVRRPRPRCGEAMDSTVHTEVAIVRSLFNWLGKRNPLVVNAAALLEAPTVHNENPHPVADDVWQRFWASPTLDDSERVAFGLAYFCGLRRHELLLLRASQFVDFPLPQIKDMKRKGNKKPHVGWGSCVDFYGARIPHLIGTVESFKAPLERLRQERATAPTLLPWAYKPPICPTTVNKRLQRALVRAGMPPKSMTPHAMRHSFCTNMIDAGVPIEVVRELAGHSSILVTQRYVKVHDDPLGRLLSLG